MRLGKRALPQAKIGESWEVADLPDDIEHGQSTVLGGPLAGRTLREIRMQHRDDLLGIATPAPDGAFPLLVKFLDAADNLSLQVHPDANYVRAHPEAHLKTEAWIVLHAKPGARVYRGLRATTTAADFRRALADGTALEHMVSFDVAPGDCVYLPSGICHALGAGILAAEVQTPSDTTFRVWDWWRNDPKRPLHIEQAFACMKFGAEQSDGIAPIVRATDAPALVANGIVTRRLCRSSYFAIESLSCERDVRIPFSATGVPEIWMTLAGSAGVRAGSDRFDSTAGNTFLLPARVEDGWIDAAAGTMLLRATCASLLDRAT
ncbi:MAG: putative mannose-6-phosphate isomerase GmuF [Planctomycetota bacterium]